MNRYRKQVSLQQLGIMMDYLETHQGLATSVYQRSKEGRSHSRLLWEQAATLINNAGGSEGSRKTPEEWRSYLCDYKSRLLHKVQKVKKMSLGAIDDGQLAQQLTPLQMRLYAIIKHANVATETDTKPGVPGATSYLYDPLQEFPLPPQAPLANKRKRKRRPRSPVVKSEPGSNLLEAATRLEQLEAMCGAGPAAAGAGGAAGGAGGADGVAAAGRDAAAAAHRIASALEKIASQGLTVRVVVEEPSRSKRRRESRRKSDTSSSDSDSE